MVEAAKTVKSILLVEDTEDIRSILKLYLEKQGYRVIEAVNGKDAVVIATRERPDLIFMDLNMPVLDGITATGLICQIDELKNVPIVISTAYTGLSMDMRIYSKIEGIQSERIHYLNKPFDINQLESLLIQLLPLNEGSLGKGAAQAD